MIKLMFYAFKKYVQIQTFVQSVSHIVDSDDLPPFPPLLVLSPTNMFLPANCYFHSQTQCPLQETLCGYYAGLSNFVQSVSHIVDTDNFQVLFAFVGIITNKYVSIGRLLI